MQILSQSFIFSLQLKIETKWRNFNFLTHHRFANAVTSQKFSRLLENRLLCSNTAGRKEMSKAFNFVTVQKEHTVDSLKFLAEIFYFHWQK